MIDSADILRDPRAALEALCGALGIGFDPAMLSWPTGPRPSDGVWARYWYDSVWRSTGFGPYREPRTMTFRPSWNRWPHNASRSTTS